jgi:phosphohistidine phosphatase
MQLLIIRHAIAFPHGTEGMAEDERPLTPEGRKRFRRAAWGLARIVRRPDLLLTSPLVRARQTAEIAAKAWGRIEPKNLDALAEGDFDGLARALAEVPEKATVAVVGHEPHVSSLLARLIGARAGTPLTFRKGGIALVDVPARLEGGGTLVFFLQPRLLRALAG